MLNYIWCFMLLIGIFFGVAKGDAQAVTGSLLNGGKDAVSLAITMAGVVATWSGLMKIAEKGGMTDGLSKKMRPLLHFLFRKPRL